MAPPPIVRGEMELNRALRRCAMKDHSWRPVATLLFLVLIIVMSSCATTTQSARKKTGYNPGAEAKHITSPAEAWR